MIVFLLWHTHLIEEHNEDVKLIGVYSSREAAQDALNRAKSLPGFRDAPEGFEIDSYQLDEDHWTSGYDTI